MDVPRRAGIIAHFERKCHRLLARPACGINVPLSQGYPREDLKADSRAIMIFVRTAYGKTPRNQFPRRFLGTVRRDTGGELSQCRREDAPVAFFISALADIRQLCAASVDKAQIRHEYSVPEPHRQ